jgi:hypothetical protein
LTTELELADAGNYDARIQELASRLAGETESVGIDVDARREDFSTPPTRTGARRNMTNDSTKPSKGPSPRLAELLNQLTPEQLEKATKAAAKLVQIRQAREATGQTDLTKPFDPTIKKMG